MPSGTVFPVHPRACGEQARPAIESSSIGSSPRLRGTAWIPCGIRVRSTAVHPRACGEQSDFPKQPGSSPRLRGTELRQGWRTCLRFIPAPAGNSNTDLSRALYSDSTGSSPRLRGTVTHYPWQVDSTSTISRHGSSPRLRGTVLEAITRFIPAPAGNSAAGVASGAPKNPVHPRACGEQCPAIRWP